MKNTSIILKELQEAQAVLASFLADDTQTTAVAQAATLFANALKAGNKILACGNGGSHADAMHFTEELTGRYRNPRPSLAAIAIAEPAYLSCAANDFGYDYVFSRYIEGVGRAGDVLLAISTSGNSPNVLNAVKEARKKKMKIVVLSGKDGGKLKGQADAEVIVPHFGYADRIQEIHIKIIHIFILLIEKELGMAEPEPTF